MRQLRVCCQRFEGKGTYPYNASLGDRLNQLGIEKPMVMLQAKNLVWLKCQCGVHVNGSTILLMALALGDRSLKLALHPKDECREHVTKHER